MGMTTNLIKNTKKEKKANTTSVAKNIINKNKKNKVRPSNPLNDPYTRHRLLLCW
jgi:hypothetical protein